MKQIMSHISLLSSCSVEQLGRGMWHLISISEPIHELGIEPGRFEC